MTDGIEKSDLKNVLLALISPFEELGEEVNYLLKLKKGNPNFIIGELEKLPLYQSLTNGAFLNTKILLEYGSSIELLTKNDLLINVVESLSKNLSFSLAERKEINLNNFKEIVKIISSKTNLNLLENIDHLNICENIIKEDQVEVLEIYLNFINGNLIQK